MIELEYLKTHCLYRLGNGVPLGMFYDCIVALRNHLGFQCEDKLVNHP